jgi:predicted DNA-binding transcriptional regulator YafY
MPPEKISKTQRWLDLISYLVGRRYPVGLEELLVRLPAYERMEADTARRYFERDKADLIELGIPLRYEQLASETGQGRWTGYFLGTHDFFLPYLKIVEGLSAPRESARRLGAGTLEVSPDHFADAVEALRRIAELPSSPFADDARRAYAKLAFDIDESTVLGDAPVHIVGPPEDGKQALGILSDALVERRPLRFRYHTMGRDEVRDREVDPYGLLMSGGRWYMVGRDHDRDQLRQFRVDRIEGPEAMSDRRGSRAPFFSVPADFSLEAYAHRQPWELGEAPPVEADIRFPFPWSLWADRNEYGTLVGTDEAGTAVRRFRVRVADPFLRWILSSEAEMELVSPPSLVEDLTSLVSEIVDLHTDMRPDDAEA